MQLLLHTSHKTTISCKLDHTIYQVKCEQTGQACPVLLKKSLGTRKVPETYTRSKHAPYFLSQSLLYGQLPLPLANHHVGL